MPRPLGQLELRGPALMAWMDALPPPVDSTIAAEAHDMIAQALRD